MGLARFWRLECLIPALLMVAAATDVTARFVRLDALAFRGEEALGQFRSRWKLGTFEPNRSFTSDRVSGDLASSSNQWEQRVFRPQVFTIDDQGFRNIPAPGASPPLVLIVGTSFTVGGGNTDADTLPSQVAARSGCRVYNAGNLEFLSARILKLTRDLGMKRGLILAEALERYVGQPIPFRPKKLAWLPYRDDLFALGHTIEDRLTISPVRIICGRWYKSLQDGRILPNLYTHNVPIRSLRDGQTALFLLDLEHPKDFNQLGPDVAAYARVRDELKAEGFDLGVVVVPDKHTVYESLLRDPLPRSGESLRYLDEFEHGLRDRQIAVVNLAPLMVARAQEVFAQGRTLFWADDTHWNPAGIAVAAQAIADSFQLRDRCARTDSSSGATPRNAPKSDPPSD